MCELMEIFSNRLCDFIANEKWTFAKTMPEWTHEYIVSSENEFSNCVRIADAIIIH